MHSSASHKQLKLNGVIQDTEYFETTSFHPNQDGRKQFETELNSSECTPPQNGLFLSNNFENKPPYTLESFKKYQSEDSLECKLDNPSESDEKGDERGNHFSLNGESSNNQEMKLELDVNSEIINGTGLEPKKNKLPTEEHNGIVSTNGHSTDISNTFDKFFDTIPLELAYNPTTKQLQVIRRDHVEENGESISNNDEDKQIINDSIPKNHDEDHQECDSAIGLEFGKSSLQESSDPERSNPESPRDTLERVSTFTSLPHTDASSFTSISSLSSNTDFNVTSCLDDFTEKYGVLTLDKDENGFIEVNLNRTADDDNSDILNDSSVSYGAKRRSVFTNLFTRNLFSWKPSSKEALPGQTWKLFHRISTSPQSSPSKEASCETSEANLVKQKAPLFANNVLSKVRKVRTDIIASSTTALILEHRPLNLPAKSEDETSKHKQQYDAMVEAARKREIREAKMKKKLLQQQLKLEDQMVHAAKLWNKDILPNWESMRSSRKARELWWQGLPPSIRGKVWKLAMGNELNITSELYEICVNRAKDRIRLSSEASSLAEEESEESTDKEGSVQLINLDVSRTFPQLCIFQKKGPYHDLLHSLLGAYVCYRPDVGYVQGMSFLAAVLILNLEVDDAFICFANLLNKPCQMAFFWLDEPMMQAYFETYEEFFKENLPNLHSHFVKQNLAPNLYLLDWTYTLYSKSMPLDVACRVWDVFFRDGEEFLFRTALGILLLYEDILLNLDFIHLAQFLTKLPEDIASDPLFRAISAVRMVKDKLKFGQILQQHIDTKAES